jgi:hypothetical protein
MSSSGNLETNENKPNASAAAKDTSHNKPLIVPKKKPNDKKKKMPPGAATMKQPFPYAYPPPPPHYMGYPSMGMAPHPHPHHPKGAAAAAAAAASAQYPHPHAYAYPHPYQMPPHPYYGYPPPPPHPYAMSMGGGAPNNAGSMAPNAASLKQGHKAAVKKSKAKPAKAKGGNTSAAAPTSLMPRAAHSSLLPHQSFMSMGNPHHSMPPPDTMHSSIATAHPAQRAAPGMEASKTPGTNNPSNPPSSRAKDTPAKRMLPAGALATSHSPGHWTKEEDDMLRNLIEDHGNTDWKSVSSFLPGRTDSACMNRWHKVVKPGLTQGPWTHEEDKLLIKLVDKYGARKWVAIAEEMKGRSGKQCRERWHNHLNPTLNKQAWSVMEDKQILECHMKMGNKWAEMAKYLPGR